VSPITSLPAIDLAFDGMPLAEPDAMGLVGVRVQQRLSMPTLCELTFCEPKGPLGEGSLQAQGMSMRMSLKGFNVPLFQGQVTAIEFCYEPSHGRLIHLRAYDLLHQLRKRWSSRTHVHVTLAGLAQDIVASLGIEVRASEPGPVRQRLIQHRDSDLEFLTEVAERSGHYFTLRGETLHVLTLEGLEEEIPLSLGTSLLETQIEVNGDSATRLVSASGWDPWKVECHRGLATNARVGRSVAAEVAPGLWGGTGNRILSDEVVQSLPQLEGLSQAELDYHVASEVVLRGVAEGDCSLRPGTRVQVEGVAPSLTGRYVLTSADHLIDGERGYITRISSAPPVPRKRSRGSVMALGLVTHVDDPEMLGRVKASLPTYGDAETDWIGVVAAGAGTGKGLVMLPDVGDQVLVLLIQGDPAQGIVLGGLYGGRKGPDWGVEKAAVRRYTFMTPGGQKLQLDDVKLAGRLEISSGSYIELGPDKVLLHARADLEIEAPGRSIIIRGKGIDFQEG
jgi:phage protein D/phage baseplate assembly protein gpV